MDSYRLKCIQVNLQHSRTATNNLIQILINQGIDIAFIQEPYTINNKLAIIPKTMRVYTGGHRRKRAAIIINNKDIDATTISQISDEDCVVVQVNYKKQLFYGTSMYYAGDSNIEEDLRKMDTILNNTKGHGLMILADTNARNKLWHDEINNDRGKKLEEFLTVNSLFIRNTNIGIPSFETARGRSWIDLTISNHILLGHITDWNIGEEESCSDHKLISFKIGGINPTRTKTFQRMRYITTEEGYIKFNSQLATHLRSTFKCERNATELDQELTNRIRQYDNIELLFKHLQKCISEACKASFRISMGRRTNLNGKTVPWWSPELTVMRKKVNALRRRYQRTRNDENLRQERKMKYIEGSHQYQSKINMEKLKSWKQFCSITEGSNPWNAVYKIAANKLRGNSSLTTLQKEDGTYTTDAASTVEYMMAHFTPDDNEQDDSEKQKQLRENVEEPINTPNDIDFTQEEILAVIKGFNPKKSPGEDGVTSDIILRAFQLFPLFFTTVYNICLQNSIFPQQWKHSLIIPIIKPGKEDSNSVTKYRPISLLNVGGKVLEKLMINRILHSINSRNLLNKKQYGFTPQRSTVDAAMAMKHFVQQNMQLHGYIVLISLDVQGAFDAAWWPSILNNLRQLECPKNLYKLSQDYFKNRTATLCTNEHKSVKEIEKGCPQGSTCGPGFWNILYNPLLNLNFTHRTEVIAFADDLLILTTGSNAVETENYANQDIKKIELWARENKIKFNDNKSKSMLVSRKKNSHNEKINIYLNDRPLQQVTELKYLGIMIDRKFRFHTHIQQIHDKSISLIHTLSKSAKLNWGLGKKALSTIYKGAIEPILTYGAPVWVEAIKNQQNRGKLQRVQRLCNIKIAKAYRTVSYDASCIIAGIQPIDLTIAGKVNLYDAMHGGRQYDAPLEPSNWTHPAEKVHIKETEETTEYPIKIYTDGSKTGDKVGAAAAIFKEDTPIRQLKYRLDGKCSNNQAEQIAILKALQELEIIQDSINVEKRAAVYTDSKITLCLINDNKKQNLIIANILKTIRALQQNEWIIHVSWVKAHIGIVGNEMADNLAKQAANGDDIEIVYSKIPKLTIATEIKESGMQKWQERWNTTLKGAVTKSFFPSIKERLKIVIPSTPEFTAIITGHGRTKSYLHRFHIIDDPTCTCGRGQQTVDHLIYECADTTQQRTLLVRDIRKSGGVWPVTFQQLANNHTKAFNQYIKSINL